MKQAFVVGQYAKMNTFTHTKALGNLVIEISDVAVADWKNEKHKITGNPLPTPKTVKEILAGSNNNRVAIYHMISQQTYTLDLSAWQNVDSNRYMRIDIGWVRL